MRNKFWMIIVFWNCYFSREACNIIFCYIWFFWTIWYFKVCSLTYWTLIESTFIKKFYFIKLKLWYCSIIFTIYWTSWLIFVKDVVEPDSIIPIIPPQAPYNVLYIPLIVILFIVTSAPSNLPINPPITASCSEN